MIIMLWQFQWNKHALMMCIKIFEWAYLYQNQIRFFPLITVTNQFFDKCEFFVFEWNTGNKKAANYLFYSTF